MKDDLEIAEHASELRRAFDRSFAEAPKNTRAASVDLLLLHIAGDAYAVRLSEVASILADKRVKPLPSPVPELLGVASFRGALVPVYDLRGLLGYAPAETSRWILLARADARTVIGLAFDRFDGHLRTTHDVVAADGRGGEHVREVVRVGDVATPVLHIQSVVDAISNRARPRDQ
jgi:purine-binding chemotaxis protein CheW